MPGKTLNILFLGDIIGKPGQRAVASSLQGLRRRYRADFVIANGENILDGFGIDRDAAAQLFKVGVEVVTTGNHVWHDKWIQSLLSSDPRVIRPHNYPGKAPGSGLFETEVRGTPVAVINIQGRDRMAPIDCPFQTARQLVRKLGSKTPIKIVDFHAESPTEKEALAHFLDGEVSAVIGTHTHVQTADETILAKGTAYITDVGACLPEPSVIGFDPLVSVRRVITQLPLRNEVAEEPAAIHGLSLTIDVSNGRAVHIERIRHESVV